LAALARDDVKALFGIVLAPLLLACASGEDCIDQSCVGFGGSATRTLTSCVKPATGSDLEELTLKDQDGEVFHSCFRRADNKDGCNAELHGAKVTYCRQ
jgi:hypothetical protein